MQTYRGLSSAELGRLKLGSVIGLLAALTAALTCSGRLY